MQSYIKTWAEQKEQFFFFREERTYPKYRKKQLNEWTENSISFLILRFLEKMSLLLKWHMFCRIIRYIPLFIAKYYKKSKSTGHFWRFFYFFLFFAISFEIFYLPLQPKGTIMVCITAKFWSSMHLACNESK